jgi:hypothetical protein
VGEYILYGITAIFVFAAGYATGMVRGYLDAQPNRDERGRFAKKD